MQLIQNWKPDIWMRDPAVYFHNGLYHCFYTQVNEEAGGYRMLLARIVSSDLKNWSAPEVLLDSPLGYSSPGNVMETEDGFVLCFQTYSIPKGELYGGQDCRLWLMKSRDLQHFSKPVMMRPEGCRAGWAASRRQIDPYMVKHGSDYYVFYKTEGCLGLLKSADLVHFEEAAREKPVLRPEQTPDGSTVENPCVIKVDGRYRMFFAPCRPGRGIGTAESEDLVHWDHVRYLDFPSVPWAAGGPTAPMVLDDRERSGRWLMFFHGDTQGAHGGMLGMAFSDDLVRWDDVQIIFT